MRDSLAPTSALRAAAEHALAYPYRVWGFGEGPALLGLIAASDLLGDDRYLRKVEELVTPWLSKPLELEDHVASAEVLIALEHRTHHGRLWEAAEGWAKLVVEAEHRDGGSPGVHRSDLKRWSTTVWVDCLHTDGPGLAALGKTLEAVAVVEESASALQDPCGLFCHGLDVATGCVNGVHWGRGCCWALLGLVGTLASVSDERLMGRLERLLAALRRHERDGRWRTIIDDPTAPWEISVSALVAEGVFAGLRDGVLGEEHRLMAERALRAALDETQDGALYVSDATPLGGPELYKNRSTGVFPWGQGPLLLALAAAEGWEPLPGGSETKEAGS